MLNFKEKVNIIQHESGVLMVRFSQEFSESETVKVSSDYEESTVAFGESVQKESTILDDLKRGDSLYHQRGVDRIMRQFINGLEEAVSMSYQSDCVLLN